MALGASHFLIYTIAKSLQKEAAVSFNLGGAPEGSSLARFKSGFGASVVSTTAVTFYTGPMWKRKVTTLVTLIREDPRQLKKLLTGEIKRVLVYSCEVGDPRAALSTEDAQFCYLSDTDILDLEPDDCGFRERQLSRLKRFGESFAYAVKVNGRVGHISWLLPPAAVRRESPPTLRLLPDEAEISGCETVPSCRGRGLYPFAIQQLLTVAHARGIRRVYMKTTADNQASQVGISKAGLRPVGTLFAVTPPLLNKRTWSVVRWKTRLPPARLSS
jgi:RimJ/RimL family protein N-acetyltransferase